MELRNLLVNDFLTNINVFLLDICMYVDTDKIGYVGYKDPFPAKSFSYTNIIL